VAKRSIHVVGAGILGLWQALTLARAGHRVRLIEASPEPFAQSQSRLAGAMLAPGCEAVDADPRIAALGREGLALWRAVYPGLVGRGSLVVAAARDLGELRRFARLASGFETIEGERLALLEPDLAGRFAQALLFPDEAHMTTPDALVFLLDTCRSAGVEVRLGEVWRVPAAEADLVVDCRGLGGREALPTLRGVRGERLVVRSHEVALSRPVRLLHPRHPIYVVPWSGGRFVVGATVIESEDTGPVTLRSALELLGAAYALHPGFAEAEIVDLAAGVRPAFPDNLPRAVAEGRLIRVNGAYRHGFLLAPVVAEAVARYLDTGASRPDVVSLA
jgi:glycine oxidase